MKRLGRLAIVVLIMISQALTSCDQGLENLNPEIINLKKNGVFIGTFNTASGEFTSITKNLEPVFYEDYCTNDYFGTIWAVMDCDDFGLCLPTDDIISIDSQGNVTEHGTLDLDCLCIGGIFCE